MPYLPDGYRTFDQGVPVWLVLVEGGLRIAVMVFAALSRVGGHGEAPAAGWWIYGVGLLIYLGSNLAQVLLPETGWSRSAVGFAAPAWTTAFWLMGIGLVTRPWPWLHHDVERSPAVVLVSGPQSMRRGPSPSSRSCWVACGAHHDAWARRCPDVPGPAT